MVRNAIKIIHRLIKMSFVTDKCKISLTGEKMVSIGESVIFHCMCPDNSTTIKWMLDNKEITISNTRYNNTSNTLTIFEVRSSDSGNYYCSDSDSVSLTVESKYFATYICTNESVLSHNSSLCYYFWSEHYSHCW